MARNSIPQNIPTGIQKSIPQFTPAFRVLKRKYGPVTTEVYGTVWGFCQMESKTCYATLQKIADETGITVRTAITHLEKLVADGYLEDTTPGRRNAPHVYKLTNKLYLEAGKMPDYDLSPQLQNMHSETPEGLQNMQGGMNNFPNGMNNSQLNILINKPINNSAESDLFSSGKEEKKDPKSHPAIQAFKEATGFYPDKDLYDFVIDKLGDHPNPDDVKKALIAWKAKGRNPRNLDWLESTIRSQSSQAAATYGIDFSESTKRSSASRAAATYSNFDF